MVQTKDLCVHRQNLLYGSWIGIFFNREFQGRGDIFSSLDFLDKRKLNLRGS